MNVIILNQSKIVPIHSMKSYREKRSVFPLILILVTRWKEHVVSTEYQEGGLQSWSGYSKEVENPWSCQEWIPVASISCG